MDTRRGFLQKVMVAAGAVAAIASGASPLVSSRAEMLSELAQHLIKTGYNIARYTKF